MTLTLNDEHVKELGLEAAILLAYVKQRGHLRDITETHSTYTASIGELVKIGYLTLKSAKRALKQLLDAGILTQDSTLLTHRTAYCKLNNNTQENTQ